MTHKNCKNYMSNNTDKFIIRYMILTQMQLSQRRTYIYIYLQMHIRHHKVKRTVRANVWKENNKQKMQGIR